ncbi:MAG TPA: molybdopterin dinucleotide binding domain-containing protein, partial [Nitriliruptorales bacterium]
CELLGQLEFLVVQDLYPTTETARLADLVLPAAGWGEKEGTFINSERRIGLQKRVRAAPGQALSDFRIFKLIAQAWGCGELLRWWSSPEAVFRILRELTRGQPCDVTGIDGYEAIEAAGGVQWPCPEGVDPLAAAPQRRLFEDGRFHHPDGRARFLFEPPTPPVEHVRARYPFVLLTGRGSSSQWHTETRTGKSATLRALAAREPDVQVHPEDALRLGIQPEELIELVSERGSMRARAFITTAVQPGQVFTSMHDVQTNQLTFPSFDPLSRQPAYKHAAVDVRRIEAWAR